MQDEQKDSGNIVPSSTTPTTSIAPSTLTSTTVNDKDNNNNNDKNSSVDMMTVARSRANSKLTKGSTTSPTITTTTSPDGGGEQRRGFIVSGGSSSGIIAPTVPIMETSSLSSSSPSKSHNISPRKQPNKGLLRFHHVIFRFKVHIMIGMLLFLCVITNIRTGWNLVTPQIDHESVFFLSPSSSETTTTTTTTATTKDKLLRRLENHSTKLDVLRTSKTSIKQHHQQHHQQQQQQPETNFTTVNSNPYNTNINSSSNNNNNNNTKMRGSPPTTTTKGNALQEQTTKATTKDDFPASVTAAIGTKVIVKEQQQQKSSPTKKSLPTKKQTTTKKSNKIQNQKRLLNPTDYIYEKNEFQWNSAPIVIEEYKLIFFTAAKVACTTWKQLFRRIAGCPDWRLQDLQRLLPHNPKYNGLKYLFDYDIETANHMMTSPEYTRAIFVRDPKKRLLSAFLDKAMENFGWHVKLHCCTENRKYKKVRKVTQIVNQTCFEQSQTLSGFVDLIDRCRDGHWDPQFDRIDSKFWPTINFVGHFETLEVDAKRLLKQVGIWDKYGKLGWGKYANSSIFKKQRKDNTNTHATNAQDRVFKWYTPDLERKVEHFYHNDYKYIGFNFTKTNLTKYNPNAVLYPKEDDWKTLQSSTDEEKPEIYDPNKQIVTPYRSITNDYSNNMLVQEGDNVYMPYSWDNSPIVIEKYKLLFFSIANCGATKWKQLFRRMEESTNWKQEGGEDGFPHNPEFNSLKYLHDYSIDAANHMMTSSEWKRVMFVRDPKYRLLSQFVKRSLPDNGKFMTDRCCTQYVNKSSKKFSKCQNMTQSFNGFLKLISNCSDPQWDPYMNRIESKYWPYINFIGHVEEMNRHGKQVLKELGVWKRYGKSGWGKYANNTMFESSDGKPGAYNEQSIRARQDLERAWQFLTPKLERRIEQLYSMDYSFPKFNFTKTNLTIYNSTTEAKEVKDITSIVDDDDDDDDEEEEEEEVDDNNNNQSDEKTISDTDNNISNKNSTESKSETSFDNVGTDGLLVQNGDYIYSSENGWDASPIVSEKYNVVFFTVPNVESTLWKQFFRRVEGYDNFMDVTIDSNNGTNILPHNPKVNGLKYLYHYSREEASKIMTSDEYKRIIFLRDPKDRFLSIFLSFKSSQERYKYVVDNGCCPKEDEEEGKDVTEILCYQQIESVAGFLEVTKNCPNDLWRPQKIRMEKKYWKYITYKGYYNNLDTYGKRILQECGLWKLFGKTGWGNTGYGDINSMFKKFTDTLQQRNKKMDNLIWDWFTPELEKLVDDVYTKDYDFNEFSFTRRGVSAWSIGQLINPGIDKKGNDSIEGKKLDLQQQRT